MLQNYTQNSPNVNAQGKPIEAHVGLPCVNVQTIIIKFSLFRMRMSGSGDKNNKTTCFSRRS